MNQKELNLKRRKTWMSYHIPGMGNLNRVKKNAIFISTANSLEHEMEKLKLCYNLKKVGMEFITEAEISIKGVKYRRDLVVLDTGKIVEIETDKRRAERFKADPQKDLITVRKLW